MTPNAAGSVCTWRSSRLPGDSTARRIGHHCQMDGSAAREDWGRRLAAIDWASYRTAYGPADEVPTLLSALRFGSGDAPPKAAGRLHDCLCHQRAFVSSAALPAFPFIAEVLASHASDRGTGRADDKRDFVAEELLEIVFGFAECTSPAYYAHSRIIQGNPSEPPEWMIELRAETKYLGELLAWWAKEGSSEESELAIWALDQLKDE